MQAKTPRARTCCRVREISSAASCVDSTQERARAHHQASHACCRERTARRASANAAADARPAGPCQGRSRPTRKHSISSSWNRLAAVASDPLRRHIWAVQDGGARTGRIPTHAAQLRPAGPGQWPVRARAVKVMAADLVSAPGCAMRRWPRRGARPRLSGWCGVGVVWGFELIRDKRPHTTREFRPTGRNERTSVQASRRKTARFSPVVVTKPAGQVAML